MICPNCAVQMHQHRQIGGGDANDKKYETWTVQKCPNCTRMVKEYYSCETMSQAEVNRLEKEMDVIVLPE